MGLERRLRAVPAIARLVEQPVSDLRALESDFVSLVRSSAIREVVDFELDCCVERPTDYPALAGKSGLTLARGAAGSLALDLVGPQGPPGPLLGSAQPQLLAAVGRFDLVVERFEQPEPEPVDRIDPQRRLVPRGRTKLARTEHLLLRAGFDVTRIWSAGEGPTLALVLVAPPTLPALWSYHPNTLAPTRVFSSDTSASRIENMTKLLAQLGNERSQQVLAGLLEHPSHSVRWAAARAAWSRDPSRGRTLVERCTHDEHPAVRAAALRSLRAEE